jgi:polysaccharide biosynthesis/export protein
MAAIRSPWFWAPVWVFLVQPCLAGIDECRLASGDVVKISVIGAHDLGHRAAVDADGRVSLALLGRLNDAGLTLYQLKSSIRELMPAKVFPPRASLGGYDVMRFRAKDPFVESADLRAEYVSLPGATRPPA